MEQQRLQNLFASEDSLDSLRWRLVQGPRAGEIALDRPGPAEHLRQTVVNQAVIDQPEYSGFKTATP